MNKKYIVSLTEAEREHLEKLARKGKRLMLESCSGMPVSSSRPTLMAPTNGPMSASPKLWRFPPLR